MNYYRKVRDGHPSVKLGLMKSERWASERWRPPKPCGLMKVRDGHPFGSDADSKKCQMFKWQKILAHSFYHILINPRGCPSLAAISLGQMVFDDFRPIKLL